MKYYKIIYSFGGAVTEDIPNDTSVIIVKEGEHKDKIGVIKREGDQIYVDLNGTRINITLEDVTSELEMKAIMFNKTRDLFSGLNDKITDSTLKECYQKIGNLEVKDSFGLGIFTRNSYTLSELIATDFSVASYNFVDRWGSDLGLNKPQPYLSFYNTENYGKSHGLAGEPGMYPLFPILGLLNHSDNPNCVCHFRSLSADKEAIIGALFALKEISAGDELTISYTTTFEDIYERFFKESQNLKKLELTTNDIYIFSNYLDGLLVSYPFVSISCNYKDLLVFLTIIDGDGDVGVIIAKIASYDNEYYKLQSYKLLLKIVELFKIDGSKLELLDKILARPTLDEAQKDKFLKQKTFFIKIINLVSNDFFNSSKLILKNYDNVIRPDSMNDLIFEFSKSL